MIRPALLSVLILLSATAPAWAVDETTPGPAGAQAFLEAVYRIQFGDNDAQALDKARIYDAGVVQLMAEDHRLNEGFIGALDNGPLCQCQDSDSVHAVVKVARWKRDKALAHVQIENLGRSQELTIDLVYEHGHWRIDDITPQRGPGLRKLLERSNKHIRHERGLKR